MSNRKVTTIADPQTCVECGERATYWRSPETGRQTARLGWCDACYEKLSARTKAKQKDYIDAWF